jgi:hypothetical protein
MSFVCVPLLAKHLHYVAFSKQVPMFSLRITTMAKSQL